MDSSTELVTGAAAQYLQRNLNIVRLLLAKGLAERGFILEPLKDARRREWVEKLQWRILQKREDVMEGAFIYVPPNARLRVPLSMCFVVDEGGQSVHNILVVGEGSEVTVSTMCVSAGRGEEHRGFTEVFLGKGARLDCVMVHSWLAKTKVVAETGVVAGEGSTFNELYVSFKTPHELRSYTRVEAERGANVLASTIYVAGAGASTLETYVVLAEAASAEVLSRIVATRGAIVRQPITVEARGEGARGHIECRGLQLDLESTIEAVPSLKSMHGGAHLTHEAAIGKLSQEELEYLMSKGFSEEEATTLLVRGFLELGIKSLPEALGPQVHAILDLISKSARG